MPRHSQLAGGRSGGAGLAAVLLLLAGWASVCSPGAVRVGRAARPWGGLAQQQGVEGSGWEGCALRQRLSLRGGVWRRQGRMDDGGPLVVTLSLINSKSFGASSRFPPKEVMDVYKRHWGRWDPTNKVWVFQADKHDALARDLRALSSGAATKGLKVSDIPQHVFSHAAEVEASVAVAGNSTQTNSNAEATDDVIARLPPPLNTKLLPFQREGVEFGVRMGGRALIGDEMGLGKTVQAIAICAAFRQDWPILVICPSSVRTMWAEELVKWMPGMLKAKDVHIVYTGRDKLPKRHVTVVSYDLVSKMAGALRAKAFGVVVADEAHYLKNSKAKRTQMATPLLLDAPRALLLTGTPALARPAELFTLLHALKPDVYPDFMKFAYRYCDAHQGLFGLDTSGSSNLKELNMLLQGVMVRRLKDDVLTELPTKRRQRVVVDVPPERLEGMARDLDAIKELDAVIADEGADDYERADAGNRKRGMISKLYVDTGKAKIPSAKEYVGDLLDGGAKLLVFAHHVEMLDAVEALAKAKKAASVRIDGSTPASKRQAIVDKFQGDASVRVAVLGLTAAGVGLTLTASNTVVFAELSWTPGVLMQAEDRAHRIGQRDSVNVHYLVARNTADDLIWESVTRKISVVGQALDDKEAKWQAPTTKGGGGGGVRGGAAALERGGRRGGHGWGRG